MSPRPALARLPLVLGLLLLLAACALKTGRLAEADRLREAGEWPAADAAYSRVVAAPDNDRELAAAFYYRGLCRLQQGLAEAAYTDFLASRTMACVLNKEDQSNRAGNLTLPMSSLCRELTAEGLADSGKSLSSDLKAESAAKAEFLVPPAYRKSN